MTDPIGALNSILKGKRTLPNGGGSYSVANSTPTGLNVPDVNLSIPTQYSQPTPAPEATMPPVAPPADYSSQPGQSTYQPAPVSQATTSTQSTQNAPTEDTGSVDYLDKYRQLALEQARHSSQGTGLYALQPGVQYTPDQIMAQRKSADDIYNQTLGEYSTAAQKQLIEQKKAKSTTPLSDMSASPWLEGLRINGLVQGGTADERAQNLAYLSSLPEERQKALVRSGLYNAMSTGERQKFDSYDEVTAGTQQIASMLPEDIATNPYKYAAEKYSVFLGGKGSKGYQDFEAVLGRITAPIINNIYGAAVTGSELARAQTFIPDLAIDSTQRVGEKLKNLAAFAEFANDSALAKKAGMPKPKLDDYIQKYTGVVDGKKSNTGGFAEEW